MRQIAVYAIGGNALSSPSGENMQQSSQVLANVLSDVIDLLEGGWGVILTHGNGPQVGPQLQPIEGGRHFRYPHGGGMDP